MLEWLPRDLLCLVSLTQQLCLCCIHGTTMNVFKGCWNITWKDTSKYVYRGYSNIPFKMSWYNHKKFNFLISNIWYVFCGLLWIKLIFVRFANHGILFLFMFYTVYEISWSWGCIWSQKILLFKCSGLEKLWWKHCILLTFLWLCKLLNTQYRQKYWTSPSSTNHLWFQVLSIPWLQVYRVKHPAIQSD